MTEEGGKGLETEESSVAPAVRLGRRRDTFLKGVGGLGAVLLVCATAGAWWETQVVTRIPKGSLGVSLSYAQGHPDGVYGPGTHLLLRRVTDVSLANQRVHSSAVVKTEEGLPITVETDVRYHAGWNSAEDVVSAGGLAAFKTSLIDELGNAASQTAQTYFVQDLAQINGAAGSVGAMQFAQDLWANMVNSDATLADLTLQGMTLTIRLTPDQRRQITTFNRENGGLYGPLSPGILSRPVVVKLGPYLLSQLTAQQLTAQNGLS